MRGIQPSLRIAKRLGQSLAEHEACPQQPDFDGSFGKPQGLGGFSHREAFDVSKNENQAILIVQPLKGLVDLFAHLGPLSQLVGRSRPRGDVFGMRNRFVMIVGVRSIPGYGMQTATLPQNLERVICRNPQDPGGYRRLATEATHVFDNAHKRLLRHVLGILTLTKNPNREPKHARLESIDQTLKRVVIAAGGSLQQAFVAFDHVRRDGFHEQARLIVPDCEILSLSVYRKISGGQQTAAKTTGIYRRTPSARLVSARGPATTFLDQGDILVLLTISTTEPTATDLGYLLHKHPDRFQTFEQSFGKVHVFFPEATDERCTAAVLLDVDPIGLARAATAGRPDAASLGQYVNDRPYVASSLLSVALSRVFGTAMGGRCALRPELPSQPRPLVARLDVLPIQGGEDFLRRVFEPLGYTVEAKRQTLDETFPAWGESRYYSVTLSAETTLSQLLTHLYVLIPVFDNTKHYFVGDDETEKLIAKGEGWLEQHPAKTEIARRYLKNRPSLYREALARLVPATETDAFENFGEDSPTPLEQAREPSLNEQRHGSVMAVLKASGARSVIDLGCSEGRLLKRLFDDPQFERIAGFDVSVMALERAAQRLHYDRLSPRQKQRLELWHGSLMYRDSRLTGFDAAVVIEVVEHFDPARLAAFERVLFGEAQPKTVILTTPNREYNAMWESLPAGAMRHTDHRFEWSREEFEVWAQRIGDHYRYAVRFLPIGPEDPALGSPTQMAVFTFQSESDAV